MTARIEDKIFDEIVKISTAQGIMGNDVVRMKDDINKLFSFIDNRFVTKEEFNPYKIDVQKELDEKVSKEAFEPIKRLAYGLVTFVLLTVFGIIINATINNK